MARRRKLWSPEGAERIGKATLYLCDCMDYMATLPDGAFDLAIVDPPYGLGGTRLVGNNSTTARNSMTKYYGDYSKKGWDVPPAATFFDELRRVSKNQIIWGGNYFELPPTRGIICWDKDQSLPSMSAWEMAWSSFDCPARLYRQRSTDLLRTHPTQKPIALYKWLLTNYAEPGDRILDTHLGSGTITVACNSYGFELVGCERDADYFRVACALVGAADRQQRL